MSWTNRIKYFHLRSDGASALDLGPRNPERAKQLPDILVPPATDFGLIPNLKFSFADAHMTLKPSGWSREITSRELPIDETLAIVNMNLSPGVKEMYSHLQSEWGYVLQGGARVTAVDEKVIFLEIFRSNHFADISLAQWIAMAPREVVKSALNLSDKFLDNVRKESTPVVKYTGFEMPSANSTPQNVRYFKYFDYKVKNPPCNAAKEH